MRVKMNYNCERRRKKKRSLKALEKFSFLEFLQ